MNVRIYHKLIHGLIVTVILTGGFCVVYGLVSTQPSRSVMLTCVVVLPFLSGCVTITNAICGMQNDVLFILRGKTLEVLESRGTSLALFRILIGFFLALGLFFLFIAGKITMMIFG